MQASSLSDSNQQVPKRRHLKPGERAMVKNVYEGILSTHSGISFTDAAELCATLTKTSCSTVYRTIKDNRNAKVPDQKETRGRKKIFIDQQTKLAIRRKVHEFFFRNELPNLKKISAEIERDKNMPKISRRVLMRTLRELNFRFLKRNRKSILVEKQEIVLWRRKYLEEMQQYRCAGKRIYFTDETWLNEGHTVNYIWQDLNIKDARNAFINGLSTGLKAPSGKGRRLIITHIGSDSGFLEGGLNVFESRKTGDYHEDMNSKVFEDWFKSILPHIESGSVIVMDNAPYHSRRVEALPTSAWRKGQIVDWLEEKNIAFGEKMLKVQLLELARLHKKKYTKYVVDEMARERGVTILRLPPYHCELNPIELIWAQIKGEVARENRTFKLKDVKELLKTAIANVQAADWHKCVLHVEGVEKKMWDLDVRAEVMVEPIIINPADDSSSDSNEMFSSSDSE